MGRYNGQMPEWSKGEDLRSSSIALRGFEPHSGQTMGSRSENSTKDSCWMGPVWADDVKMRSVSSVVERATFNRVAVGSTPTSSILTPNCSNTFI